MHLAACCTSWVYSIHFCFLLPQTQRLESFILPSFSTPTSLGKVLEGRSSYLFMPTPDFIEKSQTSNREAEPDGIKEMETMVSRQRMVCALVSTPPHLYYTIVYTSYSFFFLIFFFNVYLFLGQRETEHEQARGRERGRHRIGNRLQALSHQPRA